MPNRCNMRSSSIATNPGKKVIEAIDVVFKDYRTDQGIKMKK